ncbi:YqhR family membrane protein [Amphibacillus sp. Q70]|uniref:YqhR family membrane protein n=1 Tax=Amphibacillus sp. Q70 TaxID=3453416 RepID=UPI003F86098F
MQRLNRKKESIQVLKWRVAVTGFFAGIIWSTVWTILAFFNFTKLSPRSFILETWVQAKWADRWYGALLAIFIISLLSILIAYIYYLCFKKLTGMLPGLIYGVVIWLLLILTSSNIFAHIPYINELDRDTLITTLCILCIYGVFIGYTISYDFLDQPTSNK